jgi:hypothetical protein
VEICQDPEIARVEPLVRRPETARFTDDIYFARTRDG